MDLMVKAVRGVAYMESAAGRETAAVTLGASPAGISRGDSRCGQRLISCAMMPQRNLKTMAANCCTIRGRRGMNTFPCFSIRVHTMSSYCGMQFMDSAYPKTCWLGCYSKCNTAHY